MPVRWLAALGAFVIAQCAWGALATTWEMDFDDQTREWKEIEEQLPRHPVGKELVRLNMGSFTDHHFYVDPPSLSVGADGVIRYTAVIKTSGGALNVTFEGMRCETRELKVYALGRRDGSWARARKTDWQRIERHSKPYHFTLYREYFCPARTQPTPPKRALEALRRGVGLATSNTIDD
jgi:hypothetical protein